jgi:hypothetical protein
VILCREVLVSGLREFLAEMKAHLPVSRLAKWKTGAQMVSLGFLIVGDAAPTAAFPMSLTGEVLLWIAAVFTLVTGYDYLAAGPALHRPRQRRAHADVTSRPPPPRRRIARAPNQDAAPKRRARRRERAALRGTDGRCASSAWWAGAAAARPP